MIENKNFLNPTGFIVTIKRLPNVSFWCNSVSLPGISIGNTEQPNPFTRIPTPGDRAMFDQLILNFIVDEDMKNWLEIIKWMTQIGFPNYYSQFADAMNDQLGDLPGTPNNIYSDIEITILDNQKKPMLSFLFENCIPANISPLDLNLMDTDISPINASVTIEFSNYWVSYPSTTDSVI